VKSNLTIKFLKYWFFSWKLHQVWKTSLLQPT